MIISFDSETELIRPGHCAPPLVCITWCEDHGAPQIIDWHDALDWTREVLASGATLAGHNVAYDMGVLAAHALSQQCDLNSEIFRAYSENRVTDTMLRQKLVDIGKGKYRGFYRGEAWIQTDYDLGAVSRRHGGNADKNDPWRLHYGLLRDVPLAEWAHKGMPEPGSVITLHGPDAIRYALSDAAATRDAYYGQEERYAPEYLVDQFAQARKAWGLHLISSWGLRTSLRGVLSLESGARERLEELEIWLKEEGLVRANGVRDTKAAQARMQLACAEPRMTKAGAICLDSDACNESGDPLLEAYAELSSLKKVLSNDVAALQRGILTPIHTRFDMAETGRVTSSKPNVQNPRRLAGVRECYVPRPGRIFASADYSGLELRTFAQACITLVGHSEMAKVLNAGRDVHLAMAASILGISYEQASAEKKTPRVDNARQTSKVANFGFPGGLGAESLTLFARKAYKVRLTIDEARQLKKDWLVAWPEARDYFAAIDDMQDESGRVTITQLASNRIRGNCTYCAACNSFFQGLGADATGAALYEIVRACYCKRPCGACDGAGCEACDACHGGGISPLYGARVVNYVHDDFIVECGEEWGHWVALELERLMIRGAKPYLPDLEISAEPQLMRFWSKDAEPVIMGGRLQPWCYGYGLGKILTGIQKEQQA